MGFLLVAFRQLNPGQPPYRLREKLFQKSVHTGQQGGLYFQANACPEQSGGKYINPVIL